MWHFGDGMWGEKSDKPACKLLYRAPRRKDFYCRPDFFCLLLVFFIFLELVPTVKMPPESARLAAALLLGMGLGKMSVMIPWEYRMMNVESA